ncbi:MAG: DUF1501 domain-containing protein [Phycisphaerales bacterium]|nr:DUF1501 domain-containing protein [Phycisphaerales bacterium]
MEESPVNQRGGCGCEEYRGLSRRGFLGAMSAALASAPAWLPRVAFADDHRAGRDVIVSVVLRGGADALTMCVPWADPWYLPLRGVLAVPMPGAGLNAATDLDGYFGLPPAMVPLLEAYNAGKLAIVHACGSPDPSRSHFDAQRYLEVGKPSDMTLATGWLARHLLTSPPMKGDAVLRAMSITPGLPRSLAGGPQSLPVADLTNAGLTGRPASKAARLQILGELYADGSEPLRSIASQTQATIAMLEAINFKGYVPAGGASYGVDPFAIALKSAAALIKAQVGVEAISIELNGWDTHVSQGIFAGDMATLMQTLAGGLKAFHRDVIQSSNINVVVVAMSEFGRRIAPNSGLGTDHGHGGLMLVMGQKVIGGQVHTIWPGLDHPYDDRDLAATIDFRDVLGEIVRYRLGNATLGEVFPGYSVIERGVVVH